MAEKTESESTFGVGAVVGAGLGGLLLGVGLTVAYVLIVEEGSVFGIKGADATMTHQGGK